MKNFLAGFVAAVALCFVLCRYSGRESVRYEFHTDTTYVDHIVRDTVRVPELVYITRVDTLRVPVLVREPVDDPATVTGNKITAADSAYIALPVERKEYRTDSYHAVIEGFRPNLVSMEVFRRTAYITNTETVTQLKKPKFGVGIQAGYGYSGNGLSPYIGVGVQYNLFTF